MNKVSSIPLLPKISLRLLIGVVTLSGVTMAIIQQAVTHQTTWAVMAMSAILALVTPFLLYLASFSLANLFSSVGAVAAGHTQQRRVHTPTQVMPEHALPSETPPRDGVSHPASDTESSRVAGPAANSRTEADQP